MEEILPLGAWHHRHCAKGYRSRQSETEMTCWVVTVTRWTRRLMWMMVQGVILRQRGLEGEVGNQEEGGGVAHEKRLVES